MSDDHEMLIKCQCHDFAHIISFFYQVEHDASGRYVSDVVVSQALSYREGFFKRLWASLKYIFVPTRNLCLDDAIINISDIAKLVSFLQGAVNPVSLVNSLGAEKK